MPKINFDSLWRPSDRQGYISRGAIVTGAEFIAYLYPIMYTCFGSSNLALLRNDQPKIFEFLKKLDSEVGKMDTASIVHEANIVSIQKCVEKYKEFMDVPHYNFLKSILDPMAIRAGMTEDFLKKVRNEARFLKMKSRDLDLQIREYEPRADSCRELSEVVEKCRNRVAEIIKNLGAPLAENGPESMDDVDSAVDVRKKEIEAWHKKMKSVKEELADTSYMDLSCKDFGTK